VLLVGAGPLGALMMPGDPDARVCSSLSSIEMQALAFAVAGVVIAVLAVPSLFWTVMHVVRLHQRDVDAELLYHRQLGEAWLLLTRGGLQLVLGVALFVGAKGLSRAWHRLRSAGTPVADEGG
jgi:hypothetical protein